jgi:hypothetical protein
MQILRIFFVDLEIGGANAFIDGLGVSESAHRPEVRR